MYDPSLPPVYSLPLGYPLETEWEPVAGWPYEVSRYGDVRRVGSTRNLRASLDRYLKVTLYDNGHHETMYVHHVVTNAFLGPIPAGYERNHKDANRLNNAVTNLEYVTRSGNMRHAARLGRTTGANNHESKLTIEIVRECRRNCPNVARRARELGVTRVVKLNSEST